MRIESEFKLGFKDVLIRPKRSTMKTRADVSLHREFNFKHSNIKWSGIPIVASNMDTVGTFEMASSLYDFQIMTTIHKHYEVDLWNKFLLNKMDDFYSDLDDSSKDLIESHNSFLLFHYLCVFHYCLC